ncbi:MAG: hypothetical protein QM742_14500 [Aquabacterium sp.]
MDKTSLPEAGRASAADLHLLTAHGVQRALAARMSELTAQQREAVSGGASFSLMYDDYCGNGIRPLPIGGGGSVFGGGVIVIVNGKFPDPYQLAGFENLARSF